MKKLIILLLLPIAFLVYGFQAGIRPLSVTDALYLKIVGGYVGTVANNATFASDGHLTFSGTAKPWEDLRIEPVARTTGTNAPTFEKWYSVDGSTGSRGVYLYSFDDAATNSEKEIFFSIQMPHAWDGGAVKIHIHWIGNVSDSDSGACPYWAVEFNYAKIGGTFGNTLTYHCDRVNYTLTDIDNAITANKHYIAVIETAPIPVAADGTGISSILIGRLYRDSAVANDTYNAGGNKCGLLYIDCHYQISSLGSNDEYTK